MNEKRFTLRMNAELFELIKQTAEKNKRSTAKEIAKNKGISCNSLIASILFDYLNQKSS